MFAFRRVVLSSLCLLAVATLSGCSACTEQYDPSEAHATFNKEREVASTPHPQLTATGELPTAGAAVSIDDRYTTFCASCHGAKGHGDGPAGAALNPKPRNFADAAWQGSVDDAHIAKVIKDGGTSVGLSPLMAPWGSVLSDDEIKAMVAKIRSIN